MAHNTVMALFSSGDDASEALSRLSKTGFSKDDISVVAREEDFSEDLKGYDESSVAGEMAEGAASGGIVGGLLGLLVGLTAITVPGIGALFIGGSLAAALGLTGAAATTASGAVTGALAGGLLGALVNLGVPEKEAKVYEDRVKEGNILLTVVAKDGDSEDKIRDILSDTNAEEVSSYDLSK